MTAARPHFADFTLIADAPDRYALFDCERGRTYLVQHEDIWLEIMRPAPELPNWLWRCA